MVAKKASAKKTPAKTAVANQAPAVVKPAVAKKPAAAAKAPPPVQAKYTKMQILSELAETTSLSKKQVGAVLDGLTAIIDRHIKKRGVGEFVLPGLLKIKTVKKPARKARKGINPFTKEATVFKARPATTTVKVTPLKALKDMVN